MNPKYRICVWPTGDPKQPWTCGIVAANGKIVFPGESKRRKCDVLSFTRTFSLCTGLPVRILDAKPKFARNRS